MHQRLINRYIRIRELEVADPYVFSNHRYVNTVFGFAAAAHQSFPAIPLRLLAGLKRELLEQLGTEPF